MNRRLALGCLWLLVAVSVQLIPLPRATVGALSPAASELIDEREIVEPRTAPVAQAGAVNSPGVAHALSVNPHATLRALVFLTAFALFLLGTSREMDHRGTHLIACGILMLSVTLALAGIAQNASSSGKIYGLWSPYYDAQPFGPFINRNHFAGWMLMAIPLSLGYFCARMHRSFSVIGTSWRQRILWLSSAEANQLILIAFGIVLMALSLFMTLSRSGVICFAFSLVVFGSAVARVQTRRLHRWGLVLFLAFVSSVGAGWAGTDVLVRRFAAPNTLTLNGRLDIWQDTVGIVKAFPLVGSGLNTYATAMAFYQTPNPDYTAAEAHSDYLQLAAEGGLLVAVPAAIFLVLCTREATHRLREDRSSATAYWIRVGAMTGLLAIAMQELVDFSLQIPANSALFIVLLALAVGRSPGGDRTAVARASASA